MSAPGLPGRDCDVDPGVRTAETRWTLEGSALPVGPRAGRSTRRRTSIDVPRERRQGRRYLDEIRRKFVDSRRAASSATGWLTRDGKGFRAAETGGPWRGYRSRTPARRVRLLVAPWMLLAAAAARTTVRQ